ncbi:MAG: ABC-2 family transporter protein [Thermoguttaceae bacterium]|jgi:ABC-2 type transport system permease protein
MSPLRSYLRVLATFARNSLVRDMTFRGNFLIESVTSMAWVLMNLAFYLLIFQYTPMIGAGSGWGKYQFFLFFATSLLINSLVQTLFMTNADELSDLIRTGSLDFILLRPMDAQFLVSLRRIDWSSLSNLAVGLALMVYSLVELRYVPGLVQIVLYPLYVACGVAIYYSLMITLASTTVWIGRNLTLLDFWFYITNFSRYPMEIYRGPWGDPLRRMFTFAIPILIAVNVPARILIRPLDPQTPESWLLPLFALAAAAACLLASRRTFQQALASYRSASS